MASSGYANTATRMLGEQKHAYDPLAPVGIESLRRAESLLVRMPHIGLTEHAEASMLLLAYTFTSNITSCTALWEQLLQVSRLKLRVLKRRDRQKKRLIARLYSDSGAVARFNRMNAPDVELYRLATSLFCARWQKATRDGRSCVRGTGSTDKL
mmetsp:Transcript_67586/g.112361  ORF Transcript_67586/g.112361 Transcript_67586/m.112361 type:complete len:154 (+) Transcript_67586:364-825(+)